MRLQNGFKLNNYRSESCYSVISELKWYDVLYSAEHHLLDFIGVLLKISYEVMVHFVSYYLLHVWNFCNYHFYKDIWIRNWVTLSELKIFQWNSISRLGEWESVCQLVRIIQWVFSYETFSLALFTLTTDIGYDDGD